LKSGVVAVLRSLGGCLAAGLVVGIVVAGLGSRLVMRLLAVADPDARGIITENGNVVGDITFGGTAGLVVFIGIPSGILAGLIVYLVRRWLPTRLLWRGLALSVVLLALLGRTVIDPENFDFLFLDPAGLAVTLFGALFFVAGFALVPLADRWGPGVPRLFYRQDVTIVGGIAITIAVVLGLLELGRDIAELV
jgi:hypothetical protein